MEALQHLKAELAKASSPAVMVLAAPAVDVACAKNGLSLAELLRPFGIIRQLNGTVGGGLGGGKTEGTPSRCNAAGGGAGAAQPVLLCQLQPPTC